ncbi:MAG TPA: ATP-binding protein [Gemmatimonadales bacterium]|nr:ATP-binding protein [Gemmatimonadales bacterium]
MKAWIAWCVVFVIATIVLRWDREHVNQAHVVLVYLLLVLGGSVSGGRALGLTLTAAGLLVIDYYFQLPYDALTIDVAKPLDALVLLAFLTTAFVTTALLSLERTRAREAERRAAEVDSLGKLGAEILSTASGEDTLAALAALIRNSLDVACCRIYGADPEPRLLVVSASDSKPGPLPPPPDAASLARFFRDPVPFDTGANAVMSSLRAHDRVVGLLHVSDVKPIALDGARRRFLDALAYYAALAIERLRLVGEADRAAALNILLASVSHDLRTPLTTIKALAQDGARHGETNALAIEEQADRLGRLVGDVLDLSRLQSGALPVQPELNTAEDLVGAALRQTSVLHNGRTINTDLDLDAPALVGRFDFVQSLRVVTNLLENALRYSPPGAPVDLSVRRDDDTLVIEVRDRGPGVPVGERERIFEPFYRAPGAPPDVGRAGLGLAIARRLAELQHGSLDYVPRPGGGSIFRFSLPSPSL